MTVENATIINQLNVAWPLAADLISEGDDHIRLIKLCLRATFPAITGVVTPTHLELNYVAGVTSALQPQINLKAPLANPTFTGAVVLPATTSIGPVSAAEIAHLDGVTAPIQGQIDAKGAIAGQAWSGAHDFTGAALSVPTAGPGDATSKAASTAFVAAVAFSAVLPGQTGNAGKFMRTDGATAAWSGLGVPTQVITVNTVAAPNTCYVLDANNITLTLPGSYAEGDRQDFMLAEGRVGCAVDFGAHKYLGRDVGLLLLDVPLGRLSLNYKNPTIGMR